MEDCLEIDDENQDGVAEINNMIFGNVKSELERYKIKMAIPNVIVGSGHKISRTPGSVAFKVPFQTNPGAFYILISADPV